MLEITTTTKRLLSEERLSEFYLGLPLKYNFICSRDMKELKETGRMSLIHEDGAVTVIEITPVFIGTTLTPAAYA